MTTTKTTEGGHTKEVKQEPEVMTADKVVRLVTEVLHGMNPQPDPATIKDILAALQVKLHGEK